MCGAVLELSLAISGSLPTALAAALLFAAHPVHVEAVANIASRGELLCALGYVLAALAYWRSAQRGSASAWAGVLVLAACLSKEHGVTFLGVAAAVEVAVREPRRRLLRGLTALAPTLTYLALRRAVTGAVGAGDALPPWPDNPARPAGSFFRASADTSSRR